MCRNNKSYFISWGSCSSSSDAALSVEICRILRRAEETFQQLHTLIDPLTQRSGSIKTSRTDGDRWTERPAYLSVPMISRADPSASAWVRESIAMGQGELAGL